ncbi:MAG: hypothetical protein OEV40_14070 [Acidimicrobiia bacterium]|nr:hypothetical protein [Acidimicrobiia bacterium]
MDSIGELLQTYLSSLLSLWLVGGVAVATTVMVSGLGARLVDLWEGRRQWPAPEARVPPAERIAATKTTKPPPLTAQRGVL